MVGQSGEAADVVSEPQDLAALLHTTRSAYQDGLVEKAKVRKQLEADLKAVRANAGQGSQAFDPDASIIASYTQAWREFGGTEHFPAAQLATSRRLDELAKAWRGVLRRCDAELERFRTEYEVWAAAKRGMFRRATTEPQLPTWFSAEIQVLQAIREAVPAARVKFTQGIEDVAVPKLRATFEREAAARDRQLTETLRSNLAAVELSVELLGERGRAWQDWEPRPRASDEGPTAGVRVGGLRNGLPAPYDVQVPCVLDFPALYSLAITSQSTRRQQALALVRSIVLRTLQTLPPGQLRLSMIDPDGMGQTFAEFAHLSDYDERLLDHGVKTTSQAIERCLVEQVAHVETVISKYLRGQFDNIHDYNRNAGEMAEPHRLVVIADYPRQMTDRAAEHLLALVENGPRCGVYVVLHYATDVDGPRSVSYQRLVQGMDRIEVGSDIAQASLARGGVFEFLPDSCPPISFDVDNRPVTPAARFLESLGKAARQGADTVVTLSNFLPAVNRNRAGAVPDFTPGAPALNDGPDTWWTAFSSEQAVAPFGRSGAQGVASLFFSSTAVAGGAIVVGLPRSGKTTMLHALVLSMAMLYSPAELELYLIDAKHGVEFKAYETLPHARMVSIHSERDFSLAVLKGLQSEIRRRAELIKNTGLGLSNITEYRYSTGKALSRIVMIIDEFHELFEEADPVGAEAFAAFSDIVRMGPFSGVHLVVASQTLSSMPAMDRQTLTLLPQRVTFMCNEYDADIVMGDTNRAPKLLSRTGEGLFNPARGDEAQNVPFQGLYVPPAERARLIADLRVKADAQGWPARPRVFDGDAVVARPGTISRSNRRSRLTISVGEPFSLEEAQVITLPRSRGGNLLLLGDRDEESVPDLALRGVVHSVLQAAAEQQASLTVVDFVGDEELPESVASVRQVAQSTRAAYCRAAGLHDVLVTAAQEVSRRTSQGSYDEGTWLLVLFGLQRAQALSAVDGQYSYDDDSPTEAALLATILAGGPEVGVHVALDVDRGRALETRLGTEVLAELGLRVAGSAADPAELQLATGTYGDCPPLRFGQLLVGDQLKGKAVRCRGYAPIASNSFDGD